MDKISVMPIGAAGYKQPPLKTLASNSSLSGVGPTGFTLTKTFQSSEESEAAVTPSSLIRSSPNHRDSSPSSPSRNKMSSREGTSSSINQLQQQQSTTTSTSTIASPFPPSHLNVDQNSLFSDEINIKKKNLKWKTPSNLEENTWELPSLAFKGNYLIKQREINNTTSKSSSENLTLSSNPSNQYAVQNASGTWQYVGKAEEALERPATRNEILAIARKYDVAMKVMEETISGKSGAILDTGMQTDIMNMKTSVENEYPYPKSSKNTRIIHRMLSGTLFGQKWTDIVSSQMESQISVLCMEHGAVFSKIKTKSAVIFSLMRNALKVVLKEFNEVHAERENLEKSISLFDLEKKKMKDEFGVMLKESLNKAEEQSKILIRQEHDKFLHERREREKLSDSLRALNSIIMNMQQDTTSIRQADMQEAIDKLQMKVTNYETELEVTRPFKKNFTDLEKKVEKLNSVLEEKSNKLNEALTKLSDREALCKELLREKRDYLAESENLSAKYDEKDQIGINIIHNDKTLNTEVNEYMDKLQQQSKSNNNDTIGTSTSELLYREEENNNDFTGTRTSLMKRLVRGNASDTVGPILCARCDVDLAKTGESANKLLIELKRRGKMAPCPVFRSMLPHLNLEKEVAAKEKGPEWMFRVLRSIVHAKIRLDSYSGRNGTKRLSMPEVVWQFFEYPRNLTEDLNQDDLKNMNNLADTDRWAFFINLKEQAKIDHSEAKIFYNLLGERYGEDECTFFLHLVKCLEDVSDSKISWGTITEAGDYYHLVDKWDSLPEAERKTSYQLFIRLEHAVDAVSSILYKANERVHKTVISKIIEKSIDSKGRLAPEEEDLGEKKCIDFGVLSRVLMFVYREEQAARKTAIRLMFHTATSHLIPTDELKIFTEGMKDKLPVNLHQLKVIVRSLNSYASDVLITQLFRECFMIEGVVCYDSFLLASEKVQFFSEILRLPLYCGSIKNTSLTEKETAVLASIVEKHFVLFSEFLSDTSLDLQPYEISELKRLRESCVQQIHSDGRGLNSDGRKSLIAYRRLLYYICHIKMLYKEELGEQSFPHRVQYIEKELISLESIISDNNLTSAEELINNLKLTLAVNKIQYLWRLRQKKQLPNAISKLLGTETVNHNSQIPLRLVNNEIKGSIMDPRNDLSFLLKQIELLFMSKIACDDMDDSLRITRLSLQEHTMNTFLAQHGNRTIADYQILSFLKMVKALQSHPRVCLYMKLMLLDDKEENATVNGEYESNNILNGILEIVKEVFSGNSPWNTSTDNKTMIPKDKIEKQIVFHLKKIIPRDIMEEERKEITQSFLNNFIAGPKVDLDLVLLNLAEMEANYQSIFSVKFKMALLEIMEKLKGSEMFSIYIVHETMQRHLMHYPEVYSFRIYSMITKNKSFSNINHILTISRRQGLLRWNETASELNVHKFPLEILINIVTPINSQFNNVINLIKLWAEKCDEHIKNPLRARNPNRNNNFSRKYAKIVDSRQSMIITLDEAEKFRLLMIEFKDMQSIASVSKKEADVAACWDKYREVTATVLKYSKIACYTDALKEY